MRVVHLDVPRHFTFTVKEYLVEVDAAVNAAGHSYRQYDLNPPFWRWLMGLSTPHSPGDCFEPTVDAKTGDQLWPALRELVAHLGDVATLYGASFSLSGLTLPENVANSAYAMCSLIADNFGCGFFANCFQNLDDEIHFTGADIVSVGVEGQIGVFWALQIAAWIKAGGHTPHIVIGRHSWENFSLVHHASDLAKNAWFFQLIDSIILYEEELPDTMVALVDGLDDGDTGGIPNLAIRSAAGGVIVRHLDEAVRVRKRSIAIPYRIPDEYFTAMGISRRLLSYSLSMVRNRCFYGKCTFCAQITKHATDVAYSWNSEIERAVDACSELERHDVGMANFQDEAMRPVDLEAFCQAMIVRTVPLRWVGRMIAAAHPSQDLLRLMRQAGCIEILFGLETFERATAQSMGKITGNYREGNEALETVEAFLNEGLFVILSLIHGFPTEPLSALDLTLETVENLRQKSNQVTVIFNAFCLFHTSEIYREPERFNIQAVAPRRAVNDLQYRFDFERVGPDTILTAKQAVTMTRLRMGLDDDIFANLSERYGDVLAAAYTLDYSSFGLRHRIDHGETLLEHLFATTSGRDKTF